MNTVNLRFKSNRVRDIIQLFHEELDAPYGSGEVSVFCAMLFEAFLGWDKVRLMTSREETINQSDLLRFHWVLEDLKQHRPIQHIIGYTDFCGCRIEVNPDVLIPRPETEEMVGWLCAQQTESPTTVLDLCTGSGCIAIALKRAFPLSMVTAVDLSEAALATARRNAHNNGVEVRFVKGDVLGMGSDLSDQSDESDLSDLSDTFSIIISNPPYICDRERVAMRRNVLDYEPEMALFVPDNDPLRFYKAIASIARQRLQRDGLLVVEINEALSEEVCALFREQGLQPQLHEDFRGKSRWVSASR
ncbi:MAG: peptide chain release factor N(5)-glutamine methyltransferase [Bacteroidales bacterium]|nr:peptide chain release factor N(5)-glutamine methyltransferase [Bacteroidales bacterium]